MQLLYNRLKLTFFPYSDPSCDETYKPTVHQHRSTSVSTIKSSIKSGRYARNSSLPGSVHSVKFKNFEEKTSSSDENDNAKESVAADSGVASRKNSSLSSSSYSVVDYYRRKRFSNASSSSTAASSNWSSQSRRPSLRPVKSGLPEGASVRCVTLEQQPAQLLHHVKKRPQPYKKYSLSSAIPQSQQQSAATDAVIPNHTTTLAKSVFNSLRRDSVTTTTEISERFWVPPGIALHSQLEKQRRSLPNTPHFSGDNAALNEIRETHNEENQGEFVWFIGDLIKMDLKFFWA